MQTSALQLATVPVSTWTVLLMAIGRDPWIYFNDTPEDYIPFESRIYISLVIGTPIALLVSIPMAVVAAIVYDRRCRMFRSQVD